ncbi:hypothetical protein TorRG33x02_344850 [Trema orientale]|uniref:Uncharacterized protein n=1 Tax=Trema orientale TaxID=63057 RepID=A0A2P5APQ5_TREOI|nr:hypothetical protein TorRG33x02_344850 [Trema orientale]
MVFKYVFKHGKYNGSTKSAFWDETLRFGSERCRWSVEVGFSGSPEAMFKQGLTLFHIIEIYEAFTGLHPS